VRMMKNLPLNPPLRGGREFRCVEREAAGMQVLVGWLTPHSWRAHRDFFNGGIMIKVFIERTDFNDSAKVYFVEDLLGGKFAAVKSMKWEMEIYDNVPAKLEPSLILPIGRGRDILKLLMEAISKEGIEMESDATLRGTMKAQRYHLEDLRTLLHLKQE